MANTTKRRGFNPIIAFILGLICGIILLIGSVVGLVFFALNYKLDNIEANKDGDKYIFINADPENGGVGTVLDLVTKVIELASESDTLTISQLEELLPITASLTEGITDALTEYVDIDVAKLKTTKFSELGEFLQNAIMDIRPATLVDSFGGELGNNELVSLLLNGKEAEYVVNGSQKFAIYYDVYTLVDSHYEREDGVVLRASQEKYITEKGGGYRIYFYRENNVYYITESTDNGFTYTSTSEYRYDNYDRMSAKLTGNFYYDENGDKVEVVPITIGSFADGSALDVFNELNVTDLVEDGGDLADKIFDGVTVGDLLNGDVDFDGIIDRLEINDFVDIKPDNAIMVFLAFSVTDITQTDGVYTGIYHPFDSSEAKQCTLVIQDGFVTGVLIDDGQTAKKTCIEDVGTQVDRFTATLKIKDIIDIDGNKLLEAIKDSTIDSLADDIMQLSINELYADNIYGDNDKSGSESPDKVTLRLAVSEEKVDTEDEITFNPAYLYYVKTGDTFKLVNAGTDFAGKLTAEQFEDGVYYTYGEANSMWKLLLYVAQSEDDDTKTEMAYSVNNIATMIENVRENTKNTTMRELDEAGLLTFTNKDDLDIPVIYKGEETKIGELKLNDLVSFFVDIQKELNNKGQIG